MIYLLLRDPSIQFSSLPGVFPPDYEKACSARVSKATKNQLTDSGKMVGLAAAKAAVTIAVSCGGALAAAFLVTYNARRENRGRKDAGTDHGGQKKTRKPVPAIRSILPAGGARRIVYPAVTEDVAIESMVGDTGTSFEKRA